MSTKLDEVFVQELAGIGADLSAEFSWYTTAIVALAGFNHPEEIPYVYRLLLKKYASEPEAKVQTIKIKEALTKACGIWGAAKVWAWETPEIPGCWGLHADLARQEKLSAPLRQ
jgi:hypothetical protein